MKIKIQQCTTIMICVFGISGCATLKKSWPKRKKTQKEIKAAIKEAEDAKNIQALRTACKTGKLGEDEVRHYKSNACEATGRLMAEEFATVDCKKIKTYWSEGKQIHYTFKTVLYEPYGLRAADCDQWSIVFEDLMHWGQLNKGAMGYKLLVRLEKEQKPLEAKFVEHLKKNDAPLSGKSSRYAVAHYVMWRADQTKGESCKTYADLAKKLKEDGQHFMIKYFSLRKCSDGMPLALKHLGSDDPDARMLACRYLSKHGSAKHIKKLSILASRDGYTTTRNYRTVYPVRDTCGDAIAKIKIRN